jgi:hypothetical protein
MLAVTAHLIFRLAYYGLPLPNTYYLKLQGEPLADRLARGLVVLVENSLGAMLLMVLLSTYAFFRSRDTPTVRLLMGVVASQAAYILYVGGDAWEEYRYANRYLVPVVPLLLVLAAYGAALLAPALRRSWRIAGALFCLIALSYSIALSGLIPARLIQSVQPDWRTADVKVLLIAGVGALLLAVAIRRSRLSPTAAATGLVGLAMLSAAGAPIIHWYRQNQQDWPNNQHRAQLGAAPRRW